MKVGIITVQKSNNFGACLQAYALWNYIKSLGFDCEIIDLYRPLHAGFKVSKKFTPMRNNGGWKKFFRKKLNAIVKKDVPTFRGHLLSAQAQSKFDEFNSMIKFSKPYYGVDELFDNPPEYDIYISGSDQIWNPMMPYSIEPYFLTFVKNGGKKISYASSIGVSSLLPKEEKKYKKWLSSYDCLSVREATGAIMLGKLLRREIYQVGDPTLLLDASQWLRIERPINNTNYILLFMLHKNEKLVDFCLNLKKQSGLNLICLCPLRPIPDNDNYIVENEAGPREFLSYIQNAKLVVTDSFHGTIFSILLNDNNFLSYFSSRDKRSSRIKDLLNTFDLSNHILTDDMSLSYTSICNMKIDRNEVNKRIDQERLKCREYLIKNVNCDDKNNK